MREIFTDVRVFDGDRLMDGSQCGPDGGAIAASAAGADRDGVHSTATARRCCLA